MRAVIIAVGMVLLASTAWAAVSAHVFRADEITPLPWADPNAPDVYQDIMVGTRLAIFIISDEPGGWNGQLWHPHEEAAIGAVSGREGDPNTRNCEGSLLPLTHQKKGALVYGFEIENGPALVLICTAETPPGEWFVVDYHARTVGTCNLGLYGSGVVPDPVDPGIWFPPSLDRQASEYNILQALAFNHVAPRDFSQDTVVNFVDFALLARAWRSGAPDPNQFEPALPVDPNTPLSPDLNADDTVDLADLALFSAYWLERTDVNQPATDPNTLDAEEDPPGP